MVTSIDGTPMDGSLVRYCDAVGNKDRGDEAVFTVTTPGAVQSAQVRVAFE